MKKLLVLFALLFVTNVYSQTPIDIGDYATIWNDSIYYSASEGDETTNATYTIDLNGQYEWVQIFIEGNANNSIDSLGLKEGVFKYSNLTGYPSAGPTYIWGSYTALKDSAMNDINVMVNNTVGVSYTMWNPPMQLLKLSILNYYDALTTRNVTFSIIGKLKGKR